MSGEGYRRITVEDYHSDSATYRLANDLLAALGYSPRDVVELRITEHTVCVDVLARGGGRTRVVTHTWPLPRKGVDW